VYQTTPCPAVAPKSETSTSFRLSHFVNASVSGCVLVIPVLLMCSKIGDSRMRIRTYSETPTSPIERMNGSRHPHAENASLLIERCTIRITASETNRPSVAVTWMKLV
jgi:hypothetical protein